MLKHSKKFAQQSKIIEKPNIVDIKAIYYRTSKNVSQAIQKP